MKTDYRNKEWLIEQYVHNKLGTHKIASICGVYDGQVSYYLKKHHITLRPRYPNKIKVNCQTCDKGFYVIPSQISRKEGPRKYCSPACYLIWRRANWINPRKGHKAGELRRCLMCNQEFYAPPSQIRKYGKYCSRQCYAETKSRIYGSAHPNYNRIEIPCLNCSKVIKRIPSQINDSGHNFCSSHCFGIYMVKHQKSPSGLELFFANHLRQNNITYISQFKHTKGVADFLIPPNLIVECDGYYWHQLEAMKKRDAEKDQYLTTNGFKVLRFWESEIKANPQACVDKINEAIIN